MTVPTEVRAAARPVAPKVTDVSAQWLRRGDLRLVHPLEFEPEGTRVVLVLDVDRANDVVDIALIHADTEMATDVDVVVPKVDARTQFPVVVQSDLRSAVWRSQVGGLVGRIEPAELEQVNDAFDPVSDGEPSPYLVGLPLQGTFDGRWEFKRSEGDDLRQLSADCTRALLDDGTEWALDPRTIKPGLSADVLIELMHWLQTRTVRLSESSHEFAVEVYSSLTKDDWGEHAEIASSLIDAFGQLVMVEPVPMATGNRLAVLTAVGLAVSPENTDVIHRLGRELELV